LAAPTATEIETNSTARIRKLRIRPWDEGKRFIEIQ
jgi:hypothetical protein